MPDVPGSPALSVREDLTKDGPRIVPSVSACK